MPPRNIYDLQTKEVVLNFLSLVPQKLTLSQDCSSNDIDETQVKTDKDFVDIVNVQDGKFVGLGKEIQKIHNELQDETSKKGNVMFDGPSHSRSQSSEPPAVDVGKRLRILGDKMDQKYNPQLVAFTQQLLQLIKNPSFKEEFNSRVTSITNTDKNKIALILMLSQRLVMACTDSLRQVYDMATESIKGVIETQGGWKNAVCNHICLLGFLRVLWEHPPWERIDGYFH